MSERRLCRKCLYYELSASSPTCIHCVDSWVKPNWVDADKTEAEDAEEWNEDEWE